MSLVFHSDPNLHDCVATFLNRCKAAEFSEKTRARKTCKEQQVIQRVSHCFQTMWHVCVLWLLYRGQLTFVFTFGFWGKDFKFGLFKTVFWKNQQVVLNSLRFCKMYDCKHSRNESILHSPALFLLECKVNIPFQTCESVIKCQTKPFTADCWTLFAVI